MIRLYWLLRLLVNIGCYIELQWARETVQEIKSVQEIQVLYLTLYTINVT